MTNLLLNGGFDSDISNWTFAFGSGASVAGGQSGNCLQMTAGGSFGNTNQAIATVPNRAYQVTFYCKNGTGSTAAMTIGTAPGTSDVGSVNCPSAPAWTAVSINFLATTTITYVGLWNTGGGLTYYFDTIDAEIVIGGSVFDVLANLLAPGYYLNYPKLPRTAAVKTLPAVEFFRVGSTEHFFANGSLIYTQDRIQINLAAATYAGLETMLAAFRARLDNNRTNFILSYPLGVNIEGNDQNPQTYWLSMDYYILY